MFTYPKSSWKVFYSIFVFLITILLSSCNIIGTGTTQSQKVPYTSSPSEAKKPSLKENESDKLPSDMNLSNNLAFDFRERQQQNTLQSLYDNYDGVLSCNGDQSLRLTLEDNSHDSEKAILIIPSVGRHFLNVSPAWLGGQDYILAAYQSGDEGATWQPLNYPEDTNFYDSTLDEHEGVYENLSWRGEDVKINLHTENPHIWYQVNLSYKEENVWSEMGQPDETVLDVNLECEFDSDLASDDPSDGSNDNYEHGDNNFPIPPSGDSFADNPHNAKTVTLNTSSYPENISPEDDVDWYKFVLDQSSGVTIETLTGGDTEIWLYHGSDTNNHINHNDDLNYEAGIYSSFIEQRCYGGNYLDTGTYYVKVTSWDQIQIVDSYSVQVIATPCSIASPTPNPIRFYPNLLPSCGETNNIQLSITSATTERTKLGVYVQKCNDGEVFTSSGAYYVTVNGNRIFGPFQYSEGELYASEIIEPYQQHSGYVGFNDFQVELIPQNQTYPIKTGIVRVEGRRE